MRRIAALIVVLCCVAVRAADITMPFFVEHDAWYLRCEDDPKIPGTQGFGIGYASLKRTLPVGHQYRVSGTLGWSFLLTVDTNAVPSVSDVQAGPHLAKPPVVRITTDDEFKNALEVIFGPVKEYKFTVPVDYLGWEIPGAYSMRVGNRRVELPDGKWEMRGALGWSISLVLTNDVTLPSPANLNRVCIDVPAALDAYTVQTADGKPLLSSWTGPQTANLPPGNYKLIGKSWTAELIVKPGSVEAKLPPATAVADKPTNSLWFALNRIAYRADEAVEMVAWPGGELSIVSGHDKRIECGKVSSLFRIVPGTLSPGQYTVELRRGDSVEKRSLLIVSEEPATHFAIHAYGSILRVPVEAIEKLNEVGVNTFLDQAGIWLANESRTSGNHFMDVMDRLNWRFFAQWGTAHQPYGYGITFTDPEVIQRLTMTSLWASQYGRQHPGFLGMNVFDEGGTTRGPHFYEDASWLEYDAFAKRFGRPKPRYYGEDNEAGRAWIYDKQQQHHVIYSAIGNRLEDINAEADPGAHLYLGTQNGNLNSMAVDGGHPPLAYQAITLSTFHWYVGYINTAFAMLGNEYHFMQPKPIEFWPLIWADGHTDLTRHEVNLVVSRQVDGVGHFHWPTMLNAPGEPEAERIGALKALHARLTRYGDLFRAVRRDRTREVAVLYSLYDFAPKLIPEKGHLWSAYENAYKAAYTGHLVISGCLRRGIQAGWVSEEEILQRDGLAGRKVLIIPNITTMQPELKQKIAASGVKVIELDFATLVDQAKYDQGKEPKLNIDRVVFDKMFAALKPVEGLVGAHPQPGSPELLVTKQQQGSGEYFYCVNDRILPLAELPAPLTEYKVQKYFQPIATDVTLPVKGVVYDVFAGKEVAKAAGNVKLPVSLAKGDMALFAVLPEPIGSVQVKAGKTFTVRVVGESGKTINAAVPLEIAGEEVIYRSTTNGVYTGRWPVGATHLVVTELLSGKKAEVKFTVPAGKPVVEDKSPVIVENGKAIKRFLTTQKNIIVALGDSEGAPSEKQVAPLVEVLRQRGVTVEVRRASELCRKTFDTFVGRGLARVSAAPIDGSQGVPEIDKPVIAIGSSANNRLIQVATQERNWTRYAEIPGRGYVVHVWQPFSLTDDSVLVVANDEASLKKSIAWLVDHASSRNSERR